MADAIAVVIGYALVVTLIVWLLIRAWLGPTNKSDGL